MELTPLRTAGLVAALAFAVVSLWLYRRNRIGNGDLLLRLLVFVFPLLIVSLEPALFTWLLDQLSFKKGGGGRILGAAVVAVAVLYATSRALSRTSPCMSSARPPTSRSSPERSLSSSRRTTRARTSPR
jgi:hypothetical protein